MARKYFLSVDGGGTSLRMLLFDDDFRILGEGRGGGVNTNSTTEPDAKANIRQCLEQAFRDTKPAEIQRLYHVFVGPREFLFDALRGLTTVLEYVPMSEPEAALLAGALWRSGLVALAGTGSDVFYVPGGGIISGGAINEAATSDAGACEAGTSEAGASEATISGTVLSGGVISGGVISDADASDAGSSDKAISDAGSSARGGLPSGGSLAPWEDFTAARAVVGAWGPILGDDGGGVWIGQQAVRRAVAGLEGWAEPTMILELIRRDWRLKSYWDMVGIVHRSPAPYRKVASLTRIVGEAAEAGDGVAGAILTEAGVLMARQTVCLIGRLRIPADGLRLVTCGGAWKAHPIMFTVFKDTLTAAYPTATARRHRFEHVLAGPAREMLAQTRICGASAENRLAELFPDYTINW